MGRQSGDRHLQTIMDDRLPATECLSLIGRERVLSPYGFVKSARKVAIFIMFMHRLYHLFVRLSQMSLEMFFVY